MTTASAPRDRPGDPGREVLLAVRDFTAANDRVMGVLKGAMGMNATDLAALRFLIIREDQGRPVRPRDIADHLRISTASTTVLVDRLAAAGHVRREPDPSDGRRRVIVLTPAARAEFQRQHGSGIGAMRGALERFSDADLAVAARVIEALSAAIDPDR